MGNRPALMGRPVSLSSNGAMSRDGAGAHIRPTEPVYASSIVEPGGTTATPAGTSANMLTNMPTTTPTDTPPTRLHRRPARGLPDACSDSERHHPARVRADHHSQGRPGADDHDPSVHRSARGPRDRQGNRRSGRAGRCHVAPADHAGRDVAPETPILTGVNAAGCRCCLLLMESG